MKKTGLVLICFGLALLITGFALPEEANEERLFIKAAVNMQATVADGQDPSKGEIEEKTMEKTAAFRDRLNIEAHHFFMIGIPISLLGLGIMVIGIAKESNRS